MVMKEQENKTRNLAGYFEEFKALYVQLIIDSFNFGIYTVNT